jgi:phenylpropionate dioxygenase-like ring-hydroxylating dioxygenase large terminal subunit
MGQFLTTRWYVAAWPEQITRSFLPRTILDQPLLFYRQSNGTPVALMDRCPHRFAPLSLGRMLDGDVLECGYHGLQFNADGKCVLNPHGDGTIPPVARVRKFPLVERHGLVWIWMGDPDLAQSTPIPEMKFMAGSPSGYQTVHNYIQAKFASHLLIDNLMDLSHAEFLHRGSFSAGYAPKSTIKIDATVDSVTVDRTLFEVDIPPFMTALFDAKGKPVDHWYIFTWMAPGIIKYEFGVSTVGDSRDNGARLYATHIATPESAEKTHYFASISRDYELDNVRLDEFMRDMQYQPVATEDSPMLEAVQNRMNGQDFWSMRPVLLQVDAAPVKVRQIMDRLLKAERSTGAL